MGLLPLLLYMFAMVPAPLLCPLNWFCWTSVLSPLQKTSCRLMDPDPRRLWRLTFEAKHMLGNYLLNAAMTGRDESPPTTLPDHAGSAQTCVCARGAVVIYRLPAPSSPAGAPNWAPGRNTCEQEGDAFPSEVRRFGSL